MKKILGLALASLVVMAMVGGATWASFSDQEKSNTNLLTAGTLDLQFNGASDTGVATFSVSGTPGLKPGDNNDSSHATKALKNNGTLSGTLSVGTSATTHAAGTGPSTGTWGAKTAPTDTLHTTATMAVYIDVDASGAWNTGDIGLKSDATTYANTGATALDYATINSYASKSWASVETMAASATDGFNVNYRVPSSADNAIQGASVSIDFTFTLAQ